MNSVPVIVRFGNSYVMLEAYGRSNQLLTNATDIQIYRYATNYSKRRRLTAIFVPKPSKYVVPL